MALTYHNNNSISNITSFAQVPSGNPVLLSTATASGSSSISFTSGIDSTYDVYQFEFINIHNNTDTEWFNWNFSTDGGSNYNVTKTTTLFYTNHGEDDSGGVLGYDTGLDLAQSTADVRTNRHGSDADQCSGGSMFLFNPSSSVFVKHFIARFSIYEPSDYLQESYIGGYCNTTSPINGVIFRANSGTFSGIIKMYGIK